MATVLLSFFENNPKRQEKWMKFEHGDSFNRPLNTSEMDVTRPMMTQSIDNAGK